MQSFAEKQWLLIAAACWAAILALAVTGGYYIHRRSVAIVTHLVSHNPKPDRKAAYARLDAEQLVQAALQRHEAATSATAAGERPTTGALIAEVHPLLEQAEQRYLAALDQGTSPTAVLFQLGEINLLMGRRARGFLFLSRYWEAMGDAALARVYRQRSEALTPATP